MKYFLLLSVLFFGSYLYAQDSDLLINEFLASNTSTNISTIYSEYADWIEIINTGSASINIGGYYLTDNLKDKTKWKIPANTIIPPNGYYEFWADGRDSLEHTNFKLDKDGEAIGLFSPNGSVVDTITFGYQIDDISYGRKVDTPAVWSYLTTPTPHLPNISETINGIAETPKLSIPGGFYDYAPGIYLSAGSPNAVVRYTTDGTIPNEKSKGYPLHFRIDSTIALRVRTFEAGKLPGPVVTNTYFINEQVNLPVVSIVTDPANLFDDSIGIYITGKNGRQGDCDPTIRNLNQDWERPVNIEFYEKTGEMRINQQAGIKIFGGCSRTRFPEKSFAVYARSDYGKGSFDYQLFPDKQIKKFESFLLRSASDDQVYTMYRDGLAHTVLSDKELDIDYQAFRPSVVYINGQYWGIHNIREKVNEDYIRENHDLKTEEITLLERNADAITGTNIEYKTMMDFLNRKNLTVAANYEHLKTLMDVTQYINYEIGHIYLAEKDWPGNNIRFWKASTGKYNRWRWINYDMDQTFFHTNTNSLDMAASPNGWSWPNPPWSTLLLRRLLANSDFKNEFIQTYAYMLNTTFQPERLIRVIDSIKALIAPEIPRHISRWGGKMDPDFHENWQMLPTFDSVELWEKNIDTMRVFSRVRPQIAIDHLTAMFKLSGMVNITLNPYQSDAGKLKILNRPVNINGFTGKFFKNVPFTLEAVPNEGYKFLYWKSDDSIYTDQILQITSLSDMTLTAYFEKGVTGIEHDKLNTAFDFKLYDNYPNPFNPVTKIRFQVQSQPASSSLDKGKNIGSVQVEFVTLKVYDILGKEVAVLVNDFRKPGVYEVEFSAGSCGNASNLPSGVYFYQLRVNEFVATKKFVLLK